MRLLLRAAFRVKHHLSLVIATIFTLVGLTLANQVEMLTLGLVSNAGADFFALFGKKHRQIESIEHVSKEEILKRWDKIDRKKKGYITQEDAVFYLSKKKDSNPLNHYLYKFKKKLKLSEKNIEAFILLLLAVASFKALSLFLSRYTTQLLSIRISRDLRQQYFEHIQKLPMNFYHQFNIGSLSSRVAGDANQIATSLNSFLTNYLQAPFTILTTLYMCFYMSWQLSLVIFVALPMVILPIVFVTKRVKRITRQWQKNQEKFTSTLIDFLAGIQTVKVFAMEAFSLKKYQEQNNQMANLEAKTAKYDLLTRPILHTITTFCLAAVIIVGLHILQMSVSELLVFCGFLHLFYEPVKKFAEENANIQKGVVAAERLFEVLNIHVNNEMEDVGEPIFEFHESIQFDRVWFRYEDTWILKNVSFTINKGETVAIIGATGAGKSTIVQLLPRLYDIQKGDILIDGKSITQYSKRSVRELISYVPQKPFLFFDTIAANISFGRNFPREEIIQAAKQAHAHEFIDLLSKKYDTMLQEMGKNFSGGQQQRLAIARALAKKAPILVLDEATSSLDAISEEKIKLAIMELHGSVTQLIIAHRLSTIEHADRIIFLEDGVKIAEGTKDELLESCLAFRLMWETHFKSQKVLKNESHPALQES